MQITIDHAAAAPEAPAMISPRMICTTPFPTLTPSTFLLCRFCFYHNFPTTRPPSSSDSRPACSADNHVQFHLAQRKTARLSGQSDTQHVVRIHTDAFLGFFRFSCILRGFSSFFSVKPFSDSMTVLTPPLLPQLTVLHLFSHFQLAQINNRCSTPTIQ